MAPPGSGLAKAPPSRNAERRWACTPRNEPVFVADDFVRREVPAAFTAHHRAWRDELRRWSGRRRHDRRGGRDMDLPIGLPVVHAFPPDEGVKENRAVARQLSELGVIDGAGLLTVADVIPVHRVKNEVQAIFDKGAPASFNMLPCAINRA